MDAMAEAKSLLAAINPESRGTVAAYSDEVKTRLAALQQQVIDEAQATLGVVLAADDTVQPDGAIHDVQWVLARIRAVLADGPTPTSTTGGDTITPPAAVADEA